MKIVKKEKRLTEVIVSRQTICDKCGNKIEKPDLYNVFECRFDYKTGDVYPEGGLIHNISLDLCQDCGKDAMAILKSSGFKFNEEDFD